MAAPVFRRGFGGDTLELEAAPRFVWEAKRMADGALVQLGVLPPRYGGTSARVRLVQNDRILGDEDDERIHSQEDIFVVVDADDVVRGTVAPRGVSWVFEDTGLPVLFDNAPTTIFEARLVLFMQVGAAVSFKVGETELHDNDVIEENTVVMVTLL